MPTTRSGWLLNFSYFRMSVLSISSTRGRLRFLGRSQNASVSEGPSSQDAQHLDRVLKHQAQHVESVASEVIWADCQRS